VTVRAPRTATRGPVGRRAGPPEGTGVARGFTLLELMAVMTILGFMLLLIPPRMDTFGDRSRLESAANTLVSAFTGIRETAIIDGHEARIQFTLPGATTDRKKTGSYRYLVTSEQRRTSRALREDGQPEAARVERTNEEPWIESSWYPLPDGIVLEGFSTTAGEWIRANPRGDPVEVSFHPDGSVRPACALRLVCIDLPSRAARSLTVIVNALTAAASITEGEGDLPKSRDPSDFK